MVVYPHMPTYVHTLRDFKNGASVACHGDDYGSSSHPELYFPWLADSSDFGLLREQSSTKWEIPSPGRR